MVIKRAEVGIAANVTNEYHIRNDKKCTSLGEKYLYVIDIWLDNSKVLAKIDRHVIFSGSG